MGVEARHCSIANGINLKSMPRKDPKERKAYDVLRYQRHREAILKKLKSKRATDPDHNKTLEARRKYTAANKERINARRKARYQITREKILKQNKAWRDSNKEKLKASLMANIENKRAYDINYRKEYRKKYPERIKATQRSWYDSEKSLKSKANFTTNSTKKNAGLFEENTGKLTRKCLRLT
jgi:hypothetical protein